MSSSRRHRAKGTRHERSATSVLRVRVDDDELDEIDATAIASGRTMSAYVRDLIAADRGKASAMRREIAERIVVRPAKVDAELVATLDRMAGSLMMALGRGDLRQIAEQLRKTLITVRWVRNQVTTDTKAP